MGNIQLIRSNASTIAFSEEYIRDKWNLTGDRNDYWYVVGTAALEGLRKSLAPRHQFQSDSEPVMVFNNLLRKKLNGAFSSRADERVLLTRIADSFRQNPAFISGLDAILRRDVFVWQDALASLWAQGIDLSSDVFSPEAIIPGMLPLVQELQKRFVAEARKEAEPKLTFEQAAQAFLQKSTFPERLVIMEGFMYLTPLQRLFISASSAKGAEVCLLIPYRSEQEFGFAVMKRTYALWWGNERIEEPSTEQAQMTDLGDLQRELFDDAATPVARKDGTVQYAEFAHRHQEIRACVRQIQHLLDEGVSLKDIAVVVRDRVEMQALLQEEAELQALQGKDGQHMSFGTAPRMLLLTPLGQFILTLYRIWKDGQLDLSAKQFEMILASGWLGGYLQDTVDQFCAVQEQYFTHCRTFRQWTTALEQLRKLQALPPDERKLSRQPANAILQQQISNWDTVLGTINKACERLFTPGKEQIGGHIGRLLSELYQFDRASVYDAELKVLRRIQTVLEPLISSSSVPMDAKEFSDILNGMVREYEESRNQDEDALPILPNHIWLPTPESIDGYQKDYVFFLQIEDERFPRSTPDEWPFLGRTNSEQREIDRYLFLAVIRAAQKRLVLSWSLADERGEYRQSPYLAEAAIQKHAMRIPVQNDVEATEEDLQVDTEQRSLGRARRDHYDLEEIAHFALCPFRYKMERLDHRMRDYRESFQLQFLAQGFWYQMMYQYLSKVGRKGQGKVGIAKMLQEAMNTTEQLVRSSFPGLRELQWNDIKQRVAEQISTDSSFYGDPQYDAYAMEVRSAPTLAYLILEDDRTVRVEVALRYQFARGSFADRHVYALLHKEWLFPGNKPKKADAPEFTTAEGIEVFASQYHAVQWWQRAIRNASKPGGEGYAKTVGELKEWIARLEAGRYPKNPGEHCRYCPLQRECLGKVGEEQV